MGVAESEREMNQQASKSEGPEFAGETRRTLIAIFMWALLLILVLGALLWWLQRTAKVNRTQTIIRTIQTGAQLSIATTGSFPPVSDFGLMKSALGKTSALSELYALAAVDDTRTCFVDAWNHPLSTTTGPHFSLVVVSPGRDGILGNADDIR
jgi:hypothetical protein